MEGSVTKRGSTTGLPWSTCQNHPVSCYLLLLLINVFTSSHVNCGETKASLNLTTCVLTVNENVYNLSSLVKTPDDQPWQLNTRMQADFDSHQHVFINLCRPLPSTISTGECSQLKNSSVCLFNAKTNSTTSFGDHDNIEASYDFSHMEAINLTIKTVNRSTEIFLHCNPSLRNNQPILTRSRNNKLSIEWYDAAACPLEKVVGEDCSVYVQSINKAFDLSPLRKTNGSYDFPIKGYHYFLNVCGPINRKECKPGSAICHYSQDGKMHYSLGANSDKVTYSDGLLSLTYEGGDPYRNKEGTPRSTKIIFICNVSAGDGTPDFVEETNFTYIIHWQTKHACPRVTHSVECLWQNSTHRVDLSPFNQLQGNKMVLLPSAVVIINACSPVNTMINRMRKCPLSSGVCFNPISPDSESPKNLGQPMNPPQLLFDNQINLLYTEGDVCQSNSSIRYSTRITFTCDRNAGEGEPSLIEGGNLRDCEWLFEWRTSLVCEARPIYNHDCIFEDNLNELNVDLTQVFAPLPVISEQKKSTIRYFLINVCSPGKTKDYKEMTMSKSCRNSSICLEETLVPGDDERKIVSLGDLESKYNEYFFQGESLILRFFNGSRCDNNDPDKNQWASEIDIRCASSSKTKYVRRETELCTERLFLESSLVCGLKPPTCTYRFNDSLIDLRELSSLTHAWKAIDSPDGKVYYFNLCTKIPKGQLAHDGFSSVVECDLVNGQEQCGHSLGRQDRMVMSMEPNDDKSGKDLILTYTSENSKVCVNNPVVTTKIKFKCSKNFREPKFVEKITSGRRCEYHFEWETSHACFSHEPERVERPLIRQGEYFVDNRPEVDRAINMSGIFNNIHVVEHGRYQFILDLSGKIRDNSNCKNAALCQREINGTLVRDIGSIDTEVMVTQGGKMKLILTATDGRRCGRNFNKKVRSTFFLQCSSLESNVSEPKFFYESNDCDYIFLWDTDIVCPSKMISSSDLAAFFKSSSESGTIEMRRSYVASFFGSFLFIACIIVFAIVPTIWIVIRLSDPEKRNHLVHWIRNKFRAPVITSFHYSQVSSDSTKLVSINDDL